MGLTPSTAEAMFGAGVDVITSGPDDGPSNWRSRR
jgi:hypothetical protein